MHPYLFEKQLTESSLDTHGQALLSWHIVGWSLRYSSPQVGIVTWQNNLQKVVVIQLSIAIQIKVVNHLPKVFRLQFSVPIFSLELGQFIGTYQAIAGAIDSSESSIWLKVSHRCKYLPELLDLDLLIRIVHQYLFDFQL